MLIQPLEHRHRYRFRVRAVNKIGKSDPCEMNGDDILIKDPWGKIASQSQSDRVNVYGSEGYS